MAEETAAIKLSTNGASNLINHFYEALNKRGDISDFYVNSSAKYTAASTKADISINGKVCETLADFESLLDKQSQHGRVRYDVDSYDVQILNPEFRVACPEYLQEESGGRGRKEGDLKASLLVQVSGAVTYGAARDGNKAAFSEVFVLVPNWDAMGSKAVRGARAWLILSHNYRGM